MNTSDTRFYNPKANLLEHSSFNHANHILPPGSEAPGQGSNGRFDWSSLLTSGLDILERFLPPSQSQGGSDGLYTNPGHTPPQNNGGYTPEKLQGNIFGMPATAFYALVAALMFTVLILVIQKSK